MPNVPQTVAPNADVLHSWKEISTYVGRGVRTIQRWERMLGFPVHRSSGKLKGSVLGFRSEIDTWLHERSLRRTDDGHRLRKNLHVSVNRFVANAEAFRTRVQRFQINAQELADGMARSSTLRITLKARKSGNVAPLAS